MVALGVFLIICSVLSTSTSEEFLNKNQQIAEGIIEALQDKNFNRELLCDMQKENHVFQNRTISLVVKYIIKREVDFFRSRRTDAISRRIYSALVMKLIDIARDLPRNVTSEERINLAHRYYMTVESRDMHDNMADVQIFHMAVRLHDILITAPKLLSGLGNPNNLTPKILIKKLKDMDIKPIHFAIVLLIQYHLRSTANFAINKQSLVVLATKPLNIGAEVIDMIKALAAKMLPIAELIDIHLSHSSPLFKDTCPSSWLSIVNSNF